MRRALACLVLALFSFPLISPVLYASGRPELPACCRRTGKHHCASMQPSAAVGGGLALRATPSRCPLYPGGFTSQVLPQVLAAPAPVRTAAPDLSAGSVVPEESIRAGVATSAANANRGPPPVFS